MESKILIFDPKKINWFTYFDHVQQMSQFVSDNFILDFKMSQKVAIIIFLSSGPETRHFRYFIFHLTFVLSISGYHWAIMKNIFYSIIWSSKTFEFSQLVTNSSVTSRDVSDFSKNVFPVTYSIFISVEQFCNVT